MAGAYIKGMKMPECCEYCKLFNMEYDSCNYNNCSVGYEYSNRRMEDCPLVPVPDHGDLIDANTMIGVELYDECREEWYEQAMTVWEYLGRASTANVQIVIPADKEEV